MALGDIQLPLPRRMRMTWSTTTGTTRANARGLNAIASAKSEGDIQVERAGGCPAQEKEGDQR